MTISPTLAVPRHASASRADGVSCDVLDARPLLGGGARLDEWAQAVRSSAHANAFYASPSWARYLADTTDSVLKIVLAREPDGQPVGAVPLFEKHYALRFAVGNGVLAQKRLHVAEILGGSFALPECADVHRQVIESVFSHSPDVDALYLDAVPTDGFLWQALSDETALPRGCRLHVVDGPRPWHMVRLGACFEDYLKSLASKPAARLRRDVRQLGKALGGETALTRVTDRADVARFLGHAVAVSRKSWQHQVLGERVGDDTRRRTALEELAERGDLRAYLLHVGDTPCAFVIGYQHDGVYQFEEQAFDPAFAQHSPGAVLLFLTLQDLHAFDRPDMLNFGVGDAGYKRRFGNWERRDASCLVLRARLRNTVLSQSHRLFNGAVREAKKVVGRKVRM